MKWIYKTKEIITKDDFPEGTYGFIYKITHTPSNKSYLGKKVLIHNKKTKLTKKDLLLYEGLPGRKPTYKITQKESDWETYYGSNKTLLELLQVEDLVNFKREILILCRTKKLLTYYETQALFTYRVLEEDNKWFNDNILGKFFRKDFDM
tara:strand:+ start:2089 stop:2538 length:450 start_codon:yes stop_codon:yes gene_type:complete